MPADANDSQYREPRKQADAFQRFLSSVEALPGIQSAAFTEIVPLSQDDMDMGYFVVKENPPLAPGVHLRRTTATYANYFATMGIPLIKGHIFSEQDNLDLPRVVVIDETLARGFSERGSDRETFASTGYHAAGARNRRSRRRGSRYGLRSAAMPTIYSLPFRARTKP